MKRRLTGICLSTYLVFVLVSCLCLFLSNTFYPFLLLIILLPCSAIPVVVFWFLLFRPLMKIIENATEYAAGNAPPPLEYTKDDELNQLNTAVNYLASSANSAYDSQRTFITNISHDFRSPLTSIKGYVNAILDGTIPVEKQEKYLRIVLDETERLNKLTAGLLTLNTFDAQGTYLDMTDFDLIPVITSIIASLEQLSQEKNLTILASFELPTITVHADMGRIQQVIYNLLDNAIKFSHPDSEIVIKVIQQKNRVFVSIKDYGEGIAKENLPKIWDRFYKTDTSRGRDKNGTGLGLAIAKEIIRDHDQNIDVISTEGVGSEFVFTLSTAG
jgi:signal transduction histidine kinase